MDKHVGMLAEDGVVGALQAVAKLSQEVYLVLFMSLLRRGRKYQFDQLLQTFETA